MHKLIVMSAVYRQTSNKAKRPETETGSKDSLGAMFDRGRQVDSSNQMLWRQNPRRLDAESLRDAVLAVSGKLNLERGGPGFRDFNYTEAYAPIYDYVTPTHRSYGDGAFIVLSYAPRRIDS